MTALKKINIVVKEKNTLHLVYTIMGSKYCIFSMINTPVKGDNTTSNVMQIIAEIASKEKFPVLDMRYFDFQTKVSSALMGFDYELTEAVLKKVKSQTQSKQLFVFDGWRATDCPAKVLFPFRFIVGPNAKVKPIQGRQVVPF